MEQDTEKTIVVFRRWPKNVEGNVIALFPEIPADVQGFLCVSYETVGQHGLADYYGIIAQSSPATLDEYKGLHDELTRLGYNLAVRQRYIKRRKQT